MHVGVMLGFLAVVSVSATETLKGRDAEIRRAIPPSDHTLTAEEKQRLEELLTQAVDMPSMAKEALGKRWEKLSDADRKRYLKAFTARFKKASEGQIDYYRGTEIAYGAETADGADVKVPTTLTVKGEPTEVIYTLRKEGAGNKIVDITIDGVSTVENYRSSFGKVFDKEGISGLIARLEKEPEKK